LCGNRIYFTAKKADKTLATGKKYLVPLFG
jgi:hypothetical protein